MGIKEVYVNMQSSEKQIKNGENNIYFKDQNNTILEKKYNELLEYKYFYFINILD